MFKQLIKSNPQNWFTIPLRLVLAAIFMAHGGQKLFGWFGGHGLEETAMMFAQHLHMPPGILWASLAGMGEFFGGLSILFGCFTRLGALNIAIVMLVAISQVHWGKFFAPGGMEYPLALLGMALGLLISGAGPLSIDAMLQTQCPACQRVEEVAIS